MNNYSYVKTTFEIYYIQNKDAAFNVHDVRQFVDAVVAGFLSDRTHTHKITKSLYE